MVCESVWGGKQALQWDKGSGTLVQALGSACGRNPLPLHKAIVDGLGNI